MMQEQQPSEAFVTIKKKVIAVDGPAASGKGTLAKALADALGFAYLDTGSVYRAVALAVIENGGNPEKPEDVLKVLDEVTQNLSPAVLSDARLRHPDVARASAIVAAMPEVRHAVRDYQVAFTTHPPGDAPGAVLDGRDIGTVVCPHADVKLYITASAEERARRRFEELKAKNTPGVTLEGVLKDLNDRDHHDSTRKTSPLKAADDAHILDTTALDRQGALDAALKIVRTKIPDTSAPPAKKNLKPAI